MDGGIGKARGYFVRNCLGLEVAVSGAVPSVECGDYNWDERSTTCGRSKFELDRPTPDFQHVELVLLLDTGNVLY